MTEKRAAGKRSGVHDAPPTILMEPLMAPPAAPSDQTERAFAVLGSRVRLRILEALSIHSMTLPELADALDLNRATLRYHMAFLLEQGWVRETSPERGQGSGRPAARYRAVPHAWVGFPQRHFELLGEIALRALLESAGPDNTAAVLKEKGVRMGEDMAQGVANRADLKEWSPEAFEKLVLQGLFREFGVVGAVVARTPAQLTYRVYTCPFLELAEKMPGLVCDAVDAGFHQGIDRSMGRVSTTKLACMGHGDPFCEYRLSWTDWTHRPDATAGEEPKKERHRS